MNTSNIAFLYQPPTYRVREDRGDYAAEVDAAAVTTEKDFVRLPPDAQMMVRVVPVQVEWENPAELDELLGRY